MINNSGCLVIHYGNFCSPTMRRELEGLCFPWFLGSSELDARVSSRESTVHAHVRCVFTTVAMVCNVLASQTCALRRRSKITALYTRFSRWLTRRCLLTFKNVAVMKECGSVQGGETHLGIGSSRVFGSGASSTIWLLTQCWQLILEWDSNRTCICVPVIE